MKNKGLAILALTAALAAGSSMAAYAAGWASEDGSWVYYDSDGYRVTYEWRRGNDNLWRYLDGSGRMAVSSWVDEYYYVDENGTEYQRGMKAITIPAHDAPACRDILVKCLKFVVPEDLNVSGGNNQSMCDQRNFKARFIAHYIDTDYRCCESVVSL